MDREAEDTVGYTSGYEQGNIEWWAFAISSYIPQVWNLLMKTIDPIIYASLIELLGNNGRFSKKSGDLVPILDETKKIKSFSIRLIYSVPDFIGYSGGVDAVAKDQTFILQKLQQVPGINWTQNAVLINTKNGTMVFQFTTPIGYI
jgi:hypothetical protein